MRFIVRVTAAGTVADLNNRSDLTFVSDVQDVRAIKEQFSNHDEVRPFDAFFVKVGEGEYTEVYGIRGILPTLKRTIWKIDGELIPR